MPRPSTPLVLLIGLVLGGAGGFFLGRLTLDAPSTSVGRVPDTPEGAEEEETGAMLVGTRPTEPTGSTDQPPSREVLPPMGPGSGIRIPEGGPFRGRPPAPAAPDNRPRIKLEAGSRHGRLVVPEGHVLEMPEGTYYVDGDIEVGPKAAVHAPKATVIFEGSYQEVRGPFTVGRVRLQGSRVRVTEGATLATRDRDKDPMTPELYVEKGTTLLVEQGATVRVTSDYGYQVAGEILIDGGTFHSRFANGNGKTTGRAWLDGSRLTIRSGRFHGAGDHSFQGASILIEGGSLEIDDDLWNLGDDFRMDGGLVRNSNWGGAFHATGRVDLRGGRMVIHQRGTRGLALGQNAEFFATGGRVEIRGGDARSGQQGMLLRGRVVLNDLHVAVSTRFRDDAPEDASLDVRGTLTIAAGKSLHANGRVIDAVFEPSDKQGTLVR